MAGAVLALLFSGIPGQAQEEERPAKVSSASSADKNGAPWRYFLFLPAAYGEEKGREWPMILWLHGRSLRGNDLEQLRRYGPPAFLGKQPEFPFVVICPQLPDGAWPAKELSDLVDECLELYDVDPDRVILTGDSLGAMGAWNLAGSFPDKFAALTPVTAHGPAWVAEKLLKMPIRAWHGDADEAVPMKEHVAIIRQIQELGGDAEIKVIAGGTHGSVIGMNWRDSDWLTWIENQRRESE
ncbi:MAG: dienelactone hydrolase family protein [Verrucomicrobiales bacterium]|nr:dienelactone hydrolase family protein [Verrucomicrobiales bacterium]